MAKSRKGRKRLKAPVYHPAIVEVDPVLLEVVHVKFGTDTLGLKAGETTLEKVYNLVLPPYRSSLKSYHRAIVTLLKADPMFIEDVVRCGWLATDFAYKPPGMRPIVIVEILTFRKTSSGKPMLYITWDKSLQSYEDSYHPGLIYMSKDDDQSRLLITRIVNEMD